MVRIMKIIDYRATTAILLFLLALLFYEGLNQKEDDFLTEHGYSRQEIREGIVSAAGLYGYGSMAETFAE